MKREDLLHAAEKLINGPRAQDYGDALFNHQRIAAGWNVIVTGAMTTHGELTPAHVALMMDWVKTARLLHDTDHDDSWIDKCGYSALGAEFHEREKKIQQVQKAFMGNRNEKAG